MRAEVAKRIFPRRVATRLCLDLAPNVSLSVGVYNLVLPKRLPAAGHMHRESGDAVISSRQTLDAETAVVLDDAALIRFHELGGQKVYFLDGDVRDRQRDALRKLGDYDRQRQAQLTRTLEEFLRQRGNISATAQALYVHPNTLRQRLRRIEELTGINIKGDDWLMIEIALKLIRLEEALGRQS